MKVTETLADRKLELAQWLMALQSEEVLEKFEDLMRVLISEAQANDEIPSAHLESIAKGDADTSAGRLISLSEFKAKYARYGI